MRPILSPIALALALALTSASFAADWPAWRGPAGDGVASDASPPTVWNESTNVVWKAEVPGRGHASPVVVGDKVFIATADEQAGTQSLLGFDRTTGKTLWATQVHKGALVRMNGKNSQASATPASDGKLIYTVFAIDDALYATAINLDGKVAWQKKVGDYQSEHGYGSSPVLHGDLVIVLGDHMGDGGGYIVALNRSTGEQAWRTPRVRTSANSNYSTPTVATVAGKPQLLVHGYNLVSSFDPATGKPLWSVNGPTHVCANTITPGKDHVYISGGYPRQKLMCIKADGSGDVTETHVTWSEGKAVAYVPSMLLHNGRLYSVDDQGIASCYDSADGRLIWRERIKGPFTSSPIIAGDHLFISNEAGTTTVLKLGDVFGVVAENSLPDGQLATPAFVGDRVYIRTGTALYCIGE